MRERDEAAFAELLAAAVERGVHIVCDVRPEGVAAAALLARTLARAERRHVGTTVLGCGERLDSPATRAWLADAPALVLVGLRGARAPLDVAQLAIDGDAAEPLPARAFRLAATLAPVGDAAWCAAVGLVERAEPHALVELALARHAREPLGAVAALLDAAARGPQPARQALDAVEMLAVSPDPDRFLSSVAGGALRRTQARVRAELARATRVRPRTGFGVVVVEYQSACRLEDLVAERWRGLKPGVVVLVANHGLVDGTVAVTAKAAVPDAVDFRFGRLRDALDDEGTTLLDAETWATLRQRLGVPPAPIPRTADGPHELSALPN